MLSTPVCRDLAAALGGHDYTVDAVVAAIGGQAHRALARNVTIPAVRVLAGRDDPLATLTLLWPLQQPVRRAALDAALPGLVEPLTAAGFCVQLGDTVRATLDLRPYASDDGTSGWVAADLSPGLDTVTTPMRPDFVLGVSPASTSLAQLTLRRRVGRALDLGTGCGVQSLHLARHVDQVVATDLNPRALELARVTADLNGIDLDLRHGDLYAPVAGERFDLITSNPPYVLSPPGAAGERLTYREGNAAGDGLVERVVREGAAHLAEGGVLQVLGNWAHVRGRPWTERLAGWVTPTGCDARVVQREVLDPYEYVEVWLADAGLAGSPDYPQRYRDWLDYFERLGIEAVGLGWLVLHQAGRDQPDLRLEEWPHPLEQPIAPALAAALNAVEELHRLDDAAVLAATWRVADDVVEETTGAPGAADPSHLVWRQQRGFRRAVALDTALAGVFGACDGDLPLDRLVASVARLLDTDADDLARRTVAQARGLLRDGLLHRAAAT